MTVDILSSPPDFFLSQCRLFVRDANVYLHLGSALIVFVSLTSIQVPFIVSFTSLSVVTVFLPQNVFSIGESSADSSPWAIFVITFLSI